MADKKIQMTQRNSTNDGWDNLYPKTTGDQVVATDGTTFEAHKAENAAGAHKANNISAAVSGLSGSDVQTILTNLFQYANNSQIAVNSGKDSIYNAIVGKGTTPTSKDFSELVAGISAISTGKKFASGNIALINDGSEQYINVGGLTFRPSIVIVRGNTFGQIYIAYKVSESLSIETYNNGNMSCASGSAFPLTDYLGLYAHNTVFNSNGFTKLISYSNPFSSVTNIDWIAIE